MKQTEDRETDGRQTGGQDPYCGLR